MPPISQAAKYHLFPKQPKITYFPNSQRSPISQTAINHLFPKQPKITYFPNSQRSPISQTANFTLFECCVIRLDHYYEHLVSLEDGFIVEYLW